MAASPKHAPDLQRPIRQIQTTLNGLIAMLGNVTLDPPTDPDTVAAYLNLTAGGVTYKLELKQ